MLYLLLLSSRLLLPFPCSHFAAFLEIWQAPEREITSIHLNLNQSNVGFFLKGMFARSFPQLQEGAGGGRGFVQFLGDEVMSSRFQDRVGCALNHKVSLRPHVKLFLFFIPPTRTPTPPPKKGPLVQLGRVREALLGVGRSGE